MPLNAAGLDVSGANNPRWSGGLTRKVCEVCSKAYEVKRAQAKSRFCSLQCVGVSQRGRSKSGNGSRVTLFCAVCRSPFEVFKSHAARHHCCSKACSHKRRALITAGESNPNWSGGVSRLPYPWNFREISKRIIERDGGACRNPNCAGTDPRMTAHHINYDKQDCRDENLIALCSSCNTKANFGREAWKAFYTQLNIGVRSVRKAWEYEAFS